MAEPPCACIPSNCYWDCFQRHICQWQREQIDYWLRSLLASPAEQGQRKACDG